MYSKTGDGSNRIIGLKNVQYKLKVEAECYDTSENEFTLDGKPFELDLALVPTVI